MHLMAGSSVSAFIPFCAFEGKLRISEAISRIPNLTFPICQSFHPTSFEGQLCYKLGVNRTSKGSENREGLLLILDMNEDLFVPIESPNNKERKNDPINFSMNLMSSPSQKSAKIHIKTLSSFTAFGSGSYKMTSVKKLKGEKDFLAMSAEDTRCSLEDFEECRRRSLFEKCQCVPWELGHIQVLRCFKIMFSHLFRRVHFVHQKAETALQAIQRKLLAARFLVKGCMLMSASLKCPKTLSTSES